MVKLCIVQFTPAWGNKEQNLQHIETLLKDIDADVIVLPELCSRLATEHQAMIVAGFAEKEGENAYNSAVVALPGGALTVYRKTHLFYKEKLCFEPGNSGFFVVDHPLADCRVGVMVCNDWRYPEAARSLALLGADVVACPSNLVSTLWGVGMPARALENKVYLAVANRCGTENRVLADGSTQSLTFNGGSVIYDFNGSPLVKAGADSEQTFIVEINPPLTRDKTFNAYNDLMKDRRPDMYYKG
jgi:predicted amidohydrolase